MALDNVLLLYLLLRDEMEQSTNTSNQCDSQFNSDIYIQYIPILNYYRDKVKMLQDTILDLQDTILDLQEDNKHLTNELVALEYERIGLEYEIIVLEYELDKYN